MKVGIAILATNAYFILGLRFMKKFMHYYKGNQEIVFYFFSDKDPQPYLPEGFNNVKYFHTTNDSWVDGTNLKFKSILSIPDELSSDYLFYFDADTNVSQDFTEEWFVGDLVGGQHYADQVKGWMLERKGFDRNPLSKAYVPEDTKLPQMYYYGAFFGGSWTRMMEFCKILKTYQELDKQIHYEPGCNDESYINREFHFNPPTKVVLTPDFKFGISDKGGMENTRKMDLDVSDKLEMALAMKEVPFDIRNNKVVTV